MSKITKIRYFTKDKLAKVNQENIKAYNKYLKSNVQKNVDVKNTTYKVYQNYFNQFLVYLMEEADNIYVYDEDFLDDAIDIMEGFISFCQETLHNNKKVINTKLSVISSFYNWSEKRQFINKHPFANKLERMKNAQEEKIITSHYLNQEEIDLITKGLIEDKKFDIQDLLIWNIMLQSCNRVGAISKLTLSSLNLEAMMFEDIREKRGYKVEVVFEEDTKELIEQWLKMRKEMDDCQVDALFITKQNGEYRQMVKETIQWRIKKFGHIIGIDDFRSHSIRKTAGNLIYEETGDMSLAATMLNHKSVETTRQAYIKPESKAGARERIAKLKAEKAKKRLEEASAEDTDTQIK